MISAYLLLLVKPGEESTVVEKLNKLDEVKFTDVVYGEYDVIAKVEVQDMAALQKFLIEKIRRIYEIERTSTMITIK